LPSASENVESMSAKLRSGFASAASWIVSSRRNPTPKVRLQPGLHHVVDVRPEVRVALRLGVLLFDAEVLLRVLHALPDRTG
jgi:hypothetical protein